MRLYELRCTECATLKSIHYSQMVRHISSILQITNQMHVSRGRQHLSYTQLLMGFCVRPQLKLKCFECLINYIHEYNLDARPKTWLGPRNRLHTHGEIDWPNALILYTVCVCVWVREMVERRKTATSLYAIHTSTIYISFLVFHMYLKCKNQIIPELFTLKK